MAPLGVPEIVAAAAGARSVLDVGCGSARLTLALADAGAAEVVGIDTSLDRLAQGRARCSAHASAVRVKLIEADFDPALPFPGGRFEAAVSRLGAAVVGADRAGYARAFGRLGSPEQAMEIHRAAGLADVRVETLRRTLDVQDAAGLRSWMVAENGHMRRLDATLSDAERAGVLDELHRLVADHRTPDGSIRLPRAVTLVTSSV